MRGCLGRRSSPIASGGEMGSESLLPACNADRFVGFAPLVGQPVRRFGRTRRAITPRRASPRSNFVSQDTGNPDIDEPNPAPLSASG